MIFPQLPSGYVMNIWAKSVLLSPIIDFNTIELEHSGNQNVGTLHFTATDKNNAYTTSLVDEAFVYSEDANGSLFKGFIRSRTPKVMATGRTVEVMCEGIESLLDSIFVVSNVRDAGESDAARIAYFLATYGSQGLYNDAFGSTDLSKVQVLNASMPRQKFKTMSLRKVIESILGMASTTSDYYVDEYGRLHTFDANFPEGVTAPYVIRVGTPGVGEVPPEGLTVDFDSQTLRNDYWVRAKYRSADVRVADTTSMGLYGRRADMVDAPDADTSTKATAVGNAALRDNAYPKVRAAFDVSWPNDLNGTKRWKTGQMVTLYSTQHGLAGDQRRIVNLNWKYLSGTGQRRVTVRAGGDRLRLRSIGTTTSVLGAVGSI